MGITKQGSDVMGHMQDVTIHGYSMLSCRCYVNVLN